MEGLGLNQGRKDKPFCLFFHGCFSARFPMSHVSHFAVLGSPPLSNGWGSLTSQGLL